MPSSKRDVCVAEMINSLDDILEHTKGFLQQKNGDALPDPKAVQRVVDSLIPSLPDGGMPVDAVKEHVLGLTKGFSNSSISSTYYGFITGGSTPYALLADLLTSVYDQNVSVHLPDQSAATHIEDRALSMLMELLYLDPLVWKGRTLTTGATAGNIQGLALGREFVLQARRAGISVSELGLLEACRECGVGEIKILTTAPHSSLGKAASVVGFGRSACLDLVRYDATVSSQDLRLDLNLLEAELKAEGRACIVSVSCGEVNTGNFATYSREEMLSLRRLCDKYNAWLHVDGAFGIFSRLLANAGPEYRIVSQGGEGMELADSIGGDLHKFLNVPYDCGFFATRHPSLQKQVYQNANAAYLSTGGDVDIPSPLNIGAENSRRFRGFAVYSTLVGLGREGYTSILKSQVDLARIVAKIIDDHPSFNLLNGKWHKQRNTSATGYGDIFMIVLFNAKEDGLNSKLANVINSQRAIYVSGTSWNGRPACRIAVSNWQIDIEKDAATVRDVLESVARGG